MGVRFNFAFLAISSILSHGLGIAALIMGSLYIKNCPIEPYIPISLVVSGCVTVIMAPVAAYRLYKAYKACRRVFPGQERETEPLLPDQSNLLERSGGEKCCDAIHCLVNQVFGGIWAILSMYWVLHVYHRVSNDSSSPLYCQPQLYMFALVIVFIQLGLCIAVVAFCLCVTCSVICCAVWAIQQ